MIARFIRSIRTGTELKAEFVLREGAPKDWYWLEDRLPNVNVTRWQQRESWIASSAQSPRVMGASQMR